MGQDLFDMGSAGGGGDQASIPDLVSMASQGKAALDAGLVSKKDAKAAQKQLGLDSHEGAMDLLSKIVNPNAGGNPYVFGPTPTGLPSPMLNPATMPNPAGVKPGQRNAQIKSQQTATQDNSQKKTRNSYEGVDDILNLARGTPEYQSQLTGLDDLVKQRDKVAASNPDDAWVKPFMAMTDAFTGGHQASTFQPGAEKREAALEKFSNEIQQRRGDVTKTLMDAVTKMKTGSDQNSQNQKLNELLAMGIGGPGANGLSEVRRQNAIVAAGASYDKDPLLKQMQGTNNSLDRALSIMDGKTAVTGKNFALLQQDMINAMAQGGAATEGKVNREMVESLAAKLNDMQQYFGNVKDLRTDQPALFKQLRDLITQVKEDYNTAYKRRVGDVRSNFDNVTDDLIKKTAYDKADHLLGQMTTGKKTAAAPKVPTDDELAKMTPEQIDALHSQLGLKGVQ